MIEQSIRKIITSSKKDFIEIFKIMNGLPVTVRLLDPPLHEFLPNLKKKLRGCKCS